MAGPAALTLHAIDVHYGSVHAVQGVSLDVRRGEILGLLGPNGSGKSSTLAVAAGVIEPSGGTSVLEGRPRCDAPHDYARRVGYVPQKQALYDELTARANLTFFGRMYSLAGTDLKRRIQRALASMGLADRANQRVGTFSGGLKQRLNLAAALLHDPVVLLLDEPTAALDPASRDALFARLTRLRDEGHAILLTTHHLDEAEQSCDQIAVLDRGRLVASGKPSELLRQPIGGKSVLYGHLRVALPKFQERAIRQRLGTRVELDITGRRVRIAAATTEELGQSLAFLLASGVALDTFRSPLGTLERLMRNPTPVEQEEPCRVGSP